MALEVERVIPQAGGDHPITCIAWNRQKNEIFVGSQDTKVRVWDVETGELRRTMSVHKGWVTDLCYAPSVRLLFSSSLDSTVVVWKDPGRALQAIEHSSGPIHSLSFQPDKRVLLAGGTGYVFMYRVISNAEYRDFQPTSGAVGSTQSHTGQTQVENVEVIKLIMPIMECHTDIVRGIENNGLGRVFSSSFDSRIVLFDLDRPRDSKRPFQGGHKCHSGAIACMDICEDENFIMTGAYDGSLKTWSFEGRNLESFFDLGEVVHTVCFAPAINCILYSGRDYRVRAIDSRSWSDVTEFIADQSRFNDFKVIRLQRAEGSDMIFGVTRAREVIVWRYNPKAASRIMRGHREWVEAQCVIKVPLDQGGLGADGAMGAKLPLELQQRYIRQMEEGGYIGAGRDTSDELGAKLRSLFREFIFSGGQDGALLKWGAGDQEKTANVYRVEDEYTGHEGSILAICHVPEYECVFTGGEDRGIRSWPVETKVKVSDGAESSKVQSLRLYGHTARVSGLAYLGFDQLASVSHDMTLRRWDISHGSQVQMIERAHDAQISGVDVCHGATLSDTVVGTCAMESICKLWNAGTYECIKELRGHTSEVTQIKWAEYASCWVTAADDGQIIIWDMEGNLCQMFPFAGETVTTMGIDNVGELLVVATADRVVRLYDIEIGAAVASYRGHTDIVRSIGQLEERDLYVTASWDGTIRLWHRPRVTAEERRATLHRRLRSPERSPDDPFVRRRRRATMEEPIEAEGGAGGARPDNRSLSPGGRPGTTGHGEGHDAEEVPEDDLLRRLGMTMEKPRSLRKDKAGAVAGILWLYATNSEDAEEENNRKINKIMDVTPMPGRSERLSRAIDYHEKRLQQTLDSHQDNQEDESRSVAGSFLSRANSVRNRKGSVIYVPTGGRLQRWRDELDRKRDARPPTALRDSGFGGGGGAPGGKSFRRGESRMGRPSSQQF